MYRCSTPRFHTHSQGKNVRGPSSITSTHASRRSRASFDLSGKTAIDRSRLGYRLRHRHATLRRRCRSARAGHQPVHVDDVAKLNRGRQLKHKCVGVLAMCQRIGGQSGVQCRLLCRRRIDISSATRESLRRHRSANIEAEMGCIQGERPVFLCLKYGVERMLADGKGGAIVNLASIASLVGLADRFACSMTMVPSSQ